MANRNSNFQLDLVPNLTLNTTNSAFKKPIDNKTPAHRSIGAAPTNRDLVKNLFME